MFFEMMTNVFRSTLKPLGNLRHHSSRAGPDATQQTFWTGPLPGSGDHQTNSDTDAETSRERRHHNLTFVPRGELSHMR
jgi:hypothetical protein